MYSQRDGNASSCSDTDTMQAQALLDALAEPERTMFEKAEAMAAILKTQNWTPETIAARLGVSQSTVANRLRLLRYSEEERRRITEARLTERHARTLLRLTGEARLFMIDAVIRRHLTVAETEAAVDAALERNPNAATFAENGFEDALRQAVELLRHAGATVCIERTGEETEIVLRVPAARRA